MAYIWGYGNIPDYLTACEDDDVSERIYDFFLHGTKINLKYLSYCIPMPSQKQYLTLKEKLYNYDILSTTRYAPLVNQKVLDILERECSDKFQAIPAIIKLPDNQEIRDYFVVNVIHKVSLASLPDCIKKPEYDANSRPSGFDFCCKAYNSSIINHEDLCKDSIIPPYSLIFISDRLRKIFKKEKIKGGGFHKSLRDRVVFI